MPIVEWAMDNLLASPGAVVMRVGQLYRVPTLVPARQDNGWCKFLYETDDSGERRCRIHEYAPFGCAFFVAHGPDASRHDLSAKGLGAIIEAGANDHLYWQIWQDLHSLGRVAQDPIDALAALDRDRNS